MNSFLHVCFSPCVCVCSRPICRCVCMRVCVGFFPYQKSKQSSTNTNILCRSRRRRPRRSHTPRLQRRYSAHRLQSSCSPTGSRSEWTISTSLGTSPWCHCSNHSVLTMTPSHPILLSGRSCPLRLRRRPAHRSCSSSTPGPRTRSSSRWWNSIYRAQRWRSTHLMDLKQVCVSLDHRSIKWSYRWLCGEYYSFLFWTCVTCLLWWRTMFLNLTFTTVDYIYSGWTLGRNLMLRGLVEDIRFATICMSMQNTLTIKNLPSFSWIFVN